MYRVFVKNGCAVCKAVLIQLQQRGISYEEVDVTTTEGWELAKKIGVDSAGTIINENDEVVNLSEIS